MSKLLSFRGSKQRLWSLTMEPWRVRSPVVADFHHFDEEQADLDPLFKVKSSGFATQIIIYAFIFAFYNVYKQNIYSVMN
jgi:hypothetical protein